MEQVLQYPGKGSNVTQKKTCEQSQKGSQQGGGGGTLGEGIHLNKDLRNTLDGYEGIPRLEPTQKLEQVLVDLRLILKR